MALTKINNNTLSAITGLPAGVGGKVLQVVSDTTTDITTVASTSYTELTGLSVSITPSSTANKIILIGSVSGRNFTEQNDARVFFISFKRDTTTIYEKYAYEVHGGLGNNNRFVTPVQDLSFLDSPSSTSALTYKIQMKVDNTASGTFAQARTTTSLIAMEVAG